MDDLSDIAGGFVAAKVDYAALANILRMTIELKFGYHHPLYAKHAYTPRLTQFTVIANGFFRGPDEDRAPTSDPLELCRLSLIAVKRLRSEIVGDAVLIWRAEPAFDPDDGSLYMRLCFETL